MLAVDVGKHNCKVHAITISNGEGALKSYACDGYHALFHYPSNEAPAGAQVALGLQVNPNPPPPPPPSGQLLVSLYFSSAELIDFTKQQPKIKAQFSSTTFSSSAKYSLYEYYYMANQKFVELPGSPVSVGNAVGELLRFTSPLLGIRIDSSQGFVVELVQN